MRAEEVMSTPAITVLPQAHCKEAAELLVGNRISALPVVDAEGRLVGLVSEADLLPLETTPDPRSQETPLAPRTEVLPRRVSEVMTAQVQTVDATADVGVVAQRMLETGVRRFPVTRGERVVGVISRHDLIKVLARRDGDVEASVRGALEREGVWLAGMSVRVRDGVAVLAGTMDLATLRMAAILARSVPGVLDVRLAGVDE